MSEGHCTICLKPRHLCRPHEAADIIKSQAKRIQELEAQVPHPGDGSCDLCGAVPSVDIPTALCPPCLELLTSTESLQAENAELRVEVTGLANGSRDLMDANVRLEEENTALRAKVEVVERADKAWQDGAGELSKCGFKYVIGPGPVRTHHDTLFEALEALAGEGRMNASAMSVLDCIGAYRRFDGMTWPDAMGDEIYELGWRLRYGGGELSREDQLLAASVVSAYRELVLCPAAKRRDVVRALCADIDD